MKNNENNGNNDLKNVKILKEFYALKNNENKFFAIDNGYPYFTDNIHIIHEFKNLKDFEKFKNSHYYRSFNEKLKDLKFVKIEIKLYEN